jgi:hypothetical protein
MTDTMKMALFWDLVLCSVVIMWNTCCLCLGRWRNILRSTQMIEAADATEMSYTLLPDCTMSGLRRHGHKFKTEWRWHFINMRCLAGAQSGGILFNTYWKGKAIPLQALTGPEVSRRLRLPDFKTICAWRWQSCQPYTPAAFTPRK